MIDILITAVIVAVFYGGFKAGNSFKTIRELLEAGLGLIK